MFHTHIHACVPVPYIISITYTGMFVKCFYKKIPYTSLHKGLQKFKENNMNYMINIRLIPH